MVEIEVLHKDRKKMDTSQNNLHERNSKNSYIESSNNNHVRINKPSSKHYLKEPQQAPSNDEIKMLVAERIAVLCNE